MQDETEDKQSVSSDLIRGHINTIILRALYDGDKYGYEIISEIERKSHGQYTLKQPSLYSALKRLESEGYITSYWGGSVSGGRRKYFSLTDAGKDVSETNQSEWEYSRTVIDSLISDKDFDFTNPAPGAVNMRVLRDTVTRTSAYDDVEAENVNSEEYREKRTALDVEAAKIAEERSAFEENAARFEEERLAFAEQAAKFEAERRKYEAEMDARNDALLREREWREREIAEREQRLETDKKNFLEQAAAFNDGERVALDKRIHSQETEIDEQRAYYENILRQREEEMEYEKAAYEKRLQQREQEIIEEQEAIFREREKELLHRNYMDLISSPPTEKQTSEYDYYTAPVGEEVHEEVESAPIPDEVYEREYRPVVRKIFANSIKPEQDKTVSETRATSLDGIDFHDLEAQAAIDGIRLYTAGGKSKTQIEEASISVVHKGKALFVSSVFLFIFCLALGGIVLALSSSIEIPVFYPYLIWGIGLVVLLAAGIAFANHFGEGSLRRTTPAIINAIVLYLLLVIITLIFALGFRVDFNSLDPLTAYVILPVIFFFGVVIFGLVYYLMVRPKD